MIEEWKPVEGPYAGDRLMISSLGRLRREGAANCLRPFKTNGGYWQHTIRRDDGTKWHPLVHRLVADAFVPNPKRRPQVHHKDFDKSHNAHPNLAWVTPSENQRYSIPVCEKRRGAGHYRAKLQESDVIEIRRLRSDGETTVQIARKFTITYAAVSSICNRKTWKHI